MQDKCSFCGRSRSEVDLLISGVDGFICDMCAQQAYDIVQEEQRGHSTPLDMDHIEVIPMMTWRSRSQISSW